MIPNLIAFVLFILGIRTLLWHLQNWQIREYRFDRMKARIKTNEGLKNCFNLWFFRGVLPRPKFSARIVLIIGLVSIFSIFDLFLYTEKISGLYFLVQKYGNTPWTLPITLLIWERFIWLYVIIAVWISGWIAHYQKQKIFRAAKKIIKNSNKNIIRIGITGSYGKSSTKEILVHLLQEQFGAENILYTPENNNHELAIARLILQRKNFFDDTSLTKTEPLETKKIAVFEMGAYRRGEIKTMCDFVQPQITILTAIGQQHLDLFGSQKNIQLGKFEIAEGATDTVFFNADNDLCNQIFADKRISATPIGIKSTTIKKFSAPHQTSFHAFGEDFILPWPGEFFVSNALLAIECVRELGADVKKLAAALQTLPPLERAMQFHKHAAGFTIIKDLYSSNPAGVLAAIDHLKGFSGQKIFVGIPLLELGHETEKIHTQIFHRLASIKADVFWLKTDHEKIGQKICTKKWHGSDTKKLQTLIQNLGKDDVVLLEGRLPKNIQQYF